MNTNDLLRVCENLRPIIYKERLGTHFPFLFDKKKDQLQIQKCLRTDSENIPFIFLSMGKVVDYDPKDQTAIPEVIFRLNKKTSQGRVFVVNISVDGEKTMVVVKADTIRSSDRNLWFLQSPRTHIKGVGGIHTVISDAYMDGKRIRK
jgi:hypothetical protein